MELAQNISKYRKLRKMTQEELADTLGVTFAAVSKWERGIATPDISLILQMASLFEISLDTLFGYKIEENKIDKFSDQVEEYLKDNKYDEIIPLTNNYLSKYPNNFKVVYMCAKVYEVLAIKNNVKEYFKKGIELFEHSISLLSQNEDSEINEITLRGNIGLLYIESGEEEKGINILKKYNVNCMFDSLIAYYYTTMKDFNPRDVEPHLDHAFLSSVSDFIVVMGSYANYYKKLKEYDKGIDSLLITKNLLNDLKNQSGTITFYDKIIAYLDASLAILYYLTNNIEKTKEHLYKAYDVATLFDENPVKTVKNVKFYTKDYEDSYIEDTLGKTASEAVLKLLKEYDELIKLWEGIKNEKR